jgi:hypothetical protein
MYRNQLNDCQKDHVCSQKRHLHDSEVGLLARQSPLPLRRLRVRHEATGVFQRCSYYFLIAVHSQIKAN